MNPDEGIITQLTLATVILLVVMVMEVALAECVICVGLVVHASGDCGVGGFSFHLRVSLYPVALTGFTTNYLMCVLLFLSHPLTLSTNRRVLGVRNNIILESG